jgi:hypothetical protein
VDELWVTPEEGLSKAKELKLSPPQVRTLWELRDAATRGWDAVRDLCSAREKTKHEVLPRMMPTSNETAGFALLLPWDRDYSEHGTGASKPMPGDHPLAVGPSRFVVRDGEWMQISPPD